MKVCTRCGLQKPLDAFNRHCVTADGLRRMCRSCQIAYNREWAEHRQDVRRESQRRRYLRERDRLGRSRPKKTTREQRRAREAIRRAILRGEMVRPEMCQACGTAGSPIHAHHADYGKPLDVEWLCARCHGRVHQTDAIGAA